MCTCVRACVRVFSGPVADLLSVLCVLAKILSHASGGRSEKKGKKTEIKMLKGFKFGTFIGRFQVTW